MNKLFFEQISSGTYNFCVLLTSILTNGYCHSHISNSLLNEIFFLNQWFGSRFLNFEFEEYLCIYAVKRPFHAQDLPQWSQSTNHTIIIQFQKHIHICCHISRSLNTCEAIWGDVLLTICCLFTFHFQSFLKPLIMKLLRTKLQPGKHILFQNHCNLWWLHSNPFDHQPGYHFRRQKHCAALYVSVENGFSDLAFRYIYLQLEVVLSSKL